MAYRLIGKIASRVDILADHPLAGRIEESLVTYPQEFRFLIEGNYKIVYYVDGNNVTIVSVFDCRRDPAKLRENVPEKP